MNKTQIVIQRFNNSKTENLKFNLYSFLMKQKRIMAVIDTVIKKEVRYNKSTEDVKYYKEYEYNRDNKKILEVNRNVCGKVRSFTEYKYDRYNRKTKCIYYNNEGQINYYNLYEYKDNKSDNIFKETRFSSDNKILYYIEYKYNRKGELISYNKFSADGKKKVV